MFSVDSALKRTGFFLILCQLRCWAFNLGSPDPSTPVVNLWLAGFYLIVSIGTFSLVGPTMFIDLIASKPTFEFEIWCVWVLVCCCYLTTIFTYATALSKAKAYRTLLRSLSSAINSIPQPEMRDQLIKRIKINCVLSLIPLTSGITLFMVVLFIRQKLWLYDPDDESVIGSVWLKILNHLVFAGNIVWINSVGSFYVFTNCMLLTVCRMLISVISIYSGNFQKNIKSRNSANDLWYDRAVPTGLKPEEISRKILLHQKMSLMVREANNVFSSFLLIALSIEVIISIVYVKILKSNNKAFTFNAHTHAMHMFLLVWKNICCANLNEKLESSLLTNSNYLPQELAHCSHYLNEQRSSKAELTYGGLFPVRKSFIFTVLGTAITYALVVNQV